MACFGRHRYNAGSIDYRSGWYVPLPPRDDPPSRSRAKKNSFCVKASAAEWSTDLVPSGLDFELMDATEICFFRVPLKES